MNRSERISGPAKVVFSGATFFSKDDIKVNLEEPTFDVDTAAHGKEDERIEDAKATMSVTPDGRWNADLIAACFPYTNTVVGTEVYDAGGVPNTDCPCVLHGSDTNKLTIFAAAVTKMPEIDFSSVKTLVGAMDITGVRANNKNFSDNNSLIQLETGTGDFVDPTFNPDLIPTQSYIARFWMGNEAFFDVEGEDGFKFTPTVSLDFYKIDRYGTLGAKFKKIEAMMKFKPVSMTVQQIIDRIKIQNTGAARGRSLGLDGGMCEIIGDDGVSYCQIPLGNFKTAGFIWGDTKLRQDELGFVALRQYIAGVRQPLFTLSASAPYSS